MRVGATALGLGWDLANTFALEATRALVYDDLTQSQNGRPSAGRPSRSDRRHGPFALSH